jgi:hypothetical protein
MKIRRRSDAEPDHNFRGRARKRSRTRSPIVEDEDVDDVAGRAQRKRSQPPSRHRNDKKGGEQESWSAVRRQRSLPNIYRGEKNKQDNGGAVEVGGAMEGVKDEGVYKGKENESVGGRVWK